MFALPSAIAKMLTIIHVILTTHVSLKPLKFAHFLHDVIRCELVGVKFNIGEMRKSAKDVVIPKDFMEKDYN